MKFNAICGTPRSGSTLLCNILNQNPRFHASSTSCIPHSVRALSSLWSASPEVKSDLIDDKDATEERLVRATRAMVSAWYEDKDAEVIFDKGRLWNHQALALKQLFPESHMFVCVRDPREIIASIEKQHGKNPMLDDARSPQELELANRVERKCQPTGVVGQQIDGVLDLVKRQLPFVHPVEFTTLVSHPQRVMDAIYLALGEESFEHDFEDVKNTATDADGLYLNKFPHDGDGPVVAPKGNWSEHLPADLATQVMQRFAGYNQTFGYSNAG
jgi:sulfotransferase